MYVASVETFNFLNYFSYMFSYPNFLFTCRTLLELGASPNYKDSRGLTPIYLSVTKKTDPKICESLLHDHGTLGIQDSQGWQEVHQVRASGWWGIHIHTTTHTFTYIEPHIHTLRLINGGVNTNSYYYLTDLSLIYCNVSNRLTGCF